MWEFSKSDERVWLARMSGGTERGQENMVIAA
jgi:hypothetical protein